MLRAQARQQLLDLAVQHGIIASTDEAQVAFLGIERGVVEAVLKAAPPGAAYASGAAPPYSCLLVNLVLHPSA